MNFLTPLYILGVLAVAAPIVFHLIRRSPRTAVVFSSLMFLPPSPPRLAKRSRLDQWLLLLLRAAALALLALAFARPFFQGAAADLPGTDPRQRVVVLIDTSASMRRIDLWRKARAAALEAVAACRPEDSLAVLAFDAAPRPLLSFAESRTLEPSRRRAIASSRINGLEPSWRTTDLGRGLTDALAALAELANGEKEVGVMPRRIVLVSDLAQGSKLDALDGSRWPADVVLDLKTVAADGSNAAVQRLGEGSEFETPGEETTIRVRVANAPDSRRDAFDLAWGDAKTTSVEVPAGESRVVRVVPPPDRTSPPPLRLSGDTEPFDNELFVIPPARRDLRVAFLGADAADDPAGLLYYLVRVFDETGRRRVEVNSGPLNAAISWEKPPALVVLAGETSSSNIAALRTYADRGGTVLDVLTASGSSATLASLLGLGDAPITLVEARVARDVLLGEVDFANPLFAPLAGPQFNDFTKVHFWKYRKIDPEKVGNPRILAKFETGDPAILESRLGKGRVVLFASGWQPGDGQLARSTKFVPLMTALLDSSTPTLPDPSSYLVDDRIPIADVTSIRKPDGSTAAIAAGSTSFDGADQPGVYAVASPSGERMFAVNLDPGESKTAPLTTETLEQRGCRLVASAQVEASRRETQKQLQLSELESRQKVWRWLILAVFGLLLAETWLAARLSRPSSPPSEVPAS